MVELNRTVYERIGGDKTVSALVDAFYTNVAGDPILAPLFPNDLTETKRKQQQFLTQFLGGPSLYTEEHGHPMLRARHLPFPITPRRAKAWLTCMERAMDEINLPSPEREEMMARLTMTAHHMVNQPEEHR
ncbi:globin [Halalkalibacterium halodurans]|uniref:globin domain-containing protein n=1 Tax=Halalkalibacterium halodurans TaxID=86665 RepID=UPI001067D53C|nr:globin [Halalkalibacterium halodurans]MED3647317.1 globin [Halalkalibacterium halodurans]TES54775.1 globin [Halalkalibacterium halodurans]